MMDLMEEAAVPCQQKSKVPNLAKKMKHDGAPHPCRKFNHTGFRRKSGFTASSTNDSMRTSRAWAELVLVALS
jgi:hypothetical protein